MHVVISKGRGLKPWRCRLIGENNEQMACSQGYTRKASAKRAAQRMFVGVRIDVRPDFVAPNPPKNDWPPYENLPPDEG